MSLKGEKHNYRQLLLLIAKCLISFSSGLNLAFPSVLNQAILKPDSDIKTTPGQASWIVTSLGLSGWIGYIIIPALFEIYGRKITNIVLSLITLSGGLIFYVANSVSSLVFARLIQGLAIGGSYVSVVAICECISPKRRGYYMVLYKTSIGLGSLACHSLDFVLNWRQIAVCGALPSSISVIIFIMCAESPAFLAKRGQFDECVRTFKWYRGDSLNANNELDEFVKAQKENLRTKESENTSMLTKIKGMLLTKEYQKSFLIVTLATLCIDTSGRYFLLAYITQIATEITNSVISAKNVSLAFDCCLIFALCISYVLVKHFKRRTLLFTFGFFSVLLMFLVSVTIIIRNKLNILNMEWLTLAVILLHTFVINVGLIPVAFALTGEVYSLDHRSIGSCMSGIVSSTFLTIVMKLTPSMIDTTGVEGTYSIYGFCLFISLVLLRLILPETKDKTLQQIEYEMKGIVRSNSTDLIKYAKVNSS